MNIMQAKVEFLTPIGPELLKQIEVAGRTCYKSEDKITDVSAEPFVRGLIKRGHEAMLEHAHISMRITCDRGVSHEIVRHRLASYAQESTRYCNYGKDKYHGVSYIDLTPGLSIEDKLPQDRSRDIIDVWAEACVQAEYYYLKLLELGATPQIARSVLNNSTKTEIVVTMNLRELRHFLKLRTATAAHPQIREVAAQIKARLEHDLPVIVEDID